jgi:hypothetical protein
MVMAKCTKCGADITSTGYDTEELKLPNDMRYNIGKASARMCQMRFTCY